MVLFLPRHLPNLNPIEKGFSKIKALLEKAMTRTGDDLWRATGHLCNQFTPQVPCKGFKAAQFFVI
jgi:transposase